MIELVYYSQAATSLTPKDISSILSAAKTHNRKKDITGCLLYHNKEFLQILEGEEEVVLALFNRIKKDERHSGVILLEKEEKEERMFSDWSMAFQDCNSPKTERILFRDNIKAFSQLIDKPSRAVDLFWSMAKVIVDG